MRLFEMFAGYGGASFALKKAGIDLECVGYSEIDKFAIQCYERNHWKTESNNNGEVKVIVPKNYGDCTKINPHDLPDFDLLTGGFPCQAFSVAGKGLGELDTRGTLFHEIIRIAEVKQPKYMLLENVKGLTNKKHKETFEKIIIELDRIGYKVLWTVLNSKDYGIPQNRERVFIVCFNKNYFECLENHVNFEFPEKEKLKIFLKDILEDEVDEKYYLKENQLKRLFFSDDLKKSFSKLNPDVAGCMTGRQYASWRGNFVSDKIIQLNNPKHSNDRVYSKDGISPTLNTMQGGHRQPFIFQRPRGFNKGGLKDNCPSIGSNHWQQNNFLLKEDCKIRKLTPKECFRLMGFLNDEINLEGISNHQTYKLAGNGWDINLVSKIFQEMFRK